MAGRTLWLDSDRLQRLVRLRRPLDADGIGRVHLAAVEHNAHDPCLADQMPLCVAVDHGLLESRLEAVELGTGVAQAGDLDDGRPRCNRVPAGRRSRSMPRVVMFSPISPGRTVNPLPQSSSCSSAGIRCTCRKLG